MVMDYDIEDLLGQAMESTGRLSTPAAVRRSPVQPLEDQPRAGSQLPGASAIWLKTFGCSHNTSDSEYMHGQLQEYGYR